MSQTFAEWIEEQDPDEVECSNESALRRAYEDSREKSLVPFTDDQLELLKSILADHRDQLEQNQAGEPWQPAELKLTEEIIETIFNL